MDNVTLVARYKEIMATLETEALSSSEREALQALGRNFDRLINKRLNEIEGHGIARIKAFERASREEPTLILDIEEVA